ncbi:hypothetical protein GOV13_05650 [Candidatus Pacearchaeota archaeon]|nr:hypothetical protein [Candidatus Pacearchaeota archaeon]
MYDKLVKIALFPCSGSANYPKNHIYVIDEFYESGKRIYSADYDTVEDTKEKYKESGVEIKVTESHDVCIDCQVQLRGISKEELMKKPKIVTYPKKI